MATSFFTNNRLNIIGWIITIFFSVLGAWATINTRIYDLEKKEALVEQRITLLENQNDCQDKMIAKMYDLFVNIDNNITDIRGKLALKADKKYIN